ncbi:MAG: FAD-dependent oxidoreductase [Planctomycetota bacterium]
MSDDQRTGKRLVLLGIGHTNALLLRRWVTDPIPDVELTCLSDHRFGTYSGMLPAVLSGQVRESAMQLDVAALCRAAGAQLIVDRVAGLDRQTRRLTFEHRASLAFDALVIGIGSTTNAPKNNAMVVGVKPMQSFLTRLSDAVVQSISHRVDRPIRVAVVGGGVASIELAFCLPPFLKSCGVERHAIKIVCGGEIGSGVGPSLRRRIQRQLKRNRIAWVQGVVAHVTTQSLRLEDGSEHDADIVIWATGAFAPPLLSRLGLPADERGFIATDEMLRTTSGEPIFAVGDAGSCVSDPHPKAGVYAVRQAPVLSSNVSRFFAGRPLKSFRAQRSFLKLINTGDGKAMGEWKGFSFQGRWVLALKHWIDKRFMDQFRITD